MTESYRITCLWANRCSTGKPVPGDPISLLHSKRRTRQKFTFTKKIHYINTLKYSEIKSLLLRSSSGDEANVSTALPKFPPLTGKYTYKQLRLLPVRIDILNACINRIFSGL